MSRSMTKPTKWPVRPAKTQISLGICPVWSESLLCAHWVAKDPSFLHADREDWSDWSESSLGAQVILLVLSCCGSNVLNRMVWSLSVWFLKSPPRYDRNMQFLITYVHTHFGLALSFVSVLAMSISSLFITHVIRKSIFSCGYIHNLHWGVVSVMWTVIPLEPRHEKTFMSYVNDKGTVWSAPLLFTA